VDGERVVSGMPSGFTAFIAGMLGARGATLGARGATLGARGVTLGARGVPLGGDVVVVAAARIAAALGR